ncbi:hypothetical protein SLA2020_434950 [Shorea laevis]
MEVDKPLSSDKAKQTDEDCAIVLELSENDPHFDKKKKLLQNKGFNPKEQVFLKSSSSPDWISTTLKVMLQIARIIQLNEVELYFGEGDTCSPVKFYSPRNELEALNSILSLLDIPLSSDKCMQMKVLQELREAIIGMIHDFGDKNSVKTIVEIQSCEKEECLSRWGESKGMRTRLQIAYVEGAGRGAIAREDLNVGDIALEIPVSIVISEELVRISDMFHILETIDGISSETMLLLWSMKERHNCNSKFKIYFNTLPEKFNTGLSFGVDAIVALDGTLLFEEIMQAKELYPHILHFGKIDAATNSLKFCLSRPCSAGEQCFLSYGNFSSSHLITFYGFLPQGNNPYDIIPLDIEAAQDDYAEGRCTSNWSTHMVRPTWLSNNHNIFYYGLPSPLLDCLRRARSPMLQTKTLLQANLENEMEILQDLHSTFDNMMENLGDADEDDRENESWDVRLAVEFKDVHRGIISSILTSCHTGMKHVENEWYRCMGEDKRG